MKKNVFLLVIGIALSAGTMAQTKDIKKDQKELKNTVKDKKEDKKEAGNDLAHLRVTKATKGRKEVRQHRKSINKQKKHLKKHGVEHPGTKAQHQIKEDKEIKH